MRQMIASSSGAHVLTVTSWCKFVQNKCMCFVRLPFSLIFKVWNLSLKYIVVIISRNWNNFSNFFHVKFDVLHD
jgi:hypothetical protein